MDYPNQHRKLFKGGAEAYTKLWTRKLRDALAAGIKVGVIAVLHRGSLAAGPERFYRYFTEELGLTDFQVNTPFPGGPAAEATGAEPACGTWVRPGPDGRSIRLPRLEVAT